jgi:hypothetical protein
VGIPDSRGLPKTEKPPEQTVGTIQGQAVDSANEWWVGLALEGIKMPFTFHYDVAGGKTRRGGLVIDFMVWTKPLPTPLFVGKGGYWHSGVRDKETDFKKEWMSWKYRGTYNLPVDITELQSRTREAARAAVLSAFGRG